MKIKIWICDNEDNLLEKGEYGSFESAEEGFGKMQRRHDKQIDNAIDDILLDHDCDTPQGQGCAVCAEIV